jgi:hypothetical protein
MTKLLASCNAGDELAARKMEQQWRIYGAVLRAFAYACETCGSSLVTRAITRRIGVSKHDNVHLTLFCYFDA